jgi:CRISPR/Cas system type I-B associated protein Csh2 (Cas7 group RAMP superfamily)
MKGSDSKSDVDHFISTGVVQFGPGVSISPIEVERMTTTNKAGVQEGKDRGMAPLGWRVVQHAVYAMPFFVNPMMARKNGCSALDIELLKFLIPHAYRSTASAVRPFVEVRHAWYAEHGSPLGSCPDFRIVDALTPYRSEGQNPNEPSTSSADYAFPEELPAEVKARLASFEDLTLRDWNDAARAA